MGRLLTRSRDIFEMEKIHTLCPLWAHGLLSQIKMHDALSEYIIINTLLK